MDLEEWALRCISGPGIILASLAIGLCGIGPLLLYIEFGPADGNPIGLGLLAVLTVPVMLVGLAAGAVKTLVELLTRR